MLKSNTDHINKVDLANKLPNKLDLFYTTIAITVIIIHTSISSFIVIYNYNNKS